MCYISNYIGEINNTQIDNAKDIGIVMQMYDLIEYSDNYSKTLGSLWQYYRDESFGPMQMVLLMIFLLIIITVLRSNLKQK